MDIWGIKHRGRGGGRGEGRDVPTCATSVKRQLESLGDTVHLVNAQSNRGTLVQHLVTIAIQMPSQHISNLNNIL